MCFESKVNITSSIFLSLLVYFLFYFRRLIKNKNLQGRVQLWKRVAARRVCFVSIAQTAQDRFASISRCSSVAFPPIVAAVSSSVSGVPVVILRQSSMAVSSFIFSLLFGIPVLCAGLVGRLVTLGSAIC